MLTDLGLSSLEERRRQQRLTLLYKVVKGHVPAINIKGKRDQNVPSGQNNEDFVKTNIVEKSVCNNNQCFVPILANSEHYKNSFFVRTTYDWNQLCDSSVSCDTVESFRTIISKRE